MGSIMRAIVLLSLVLAFPTAVVGQEARLERIRGAFPADAVSRIEEIVAAARAAGVPADPLLDKALEGAAKSVQADRVVAAVSAYAERLGTAKTLVGAGREASVMVAAADALRRGVPPEVVRSLSGEHPSDIAIPLVVLGDLIDASVPVDHAYEVVLGALERRQGVDELLAIPAAIRRLIREGKLPAEAAEVVAWALTQGGLPAAIALPAGPIIGPPGGPPVPPGAGPPDKVAPPSKKPPVKPPGGGV